jgi:FeS assembly SUF system protein
VKSLTVLPHSGKVDQLRAEAAKAPPTPKKERPIHPHVNRISASPAALKSERQLEIEREVIKVIRKVFDPEIPVNIYDLGLIYGVEVSADGAAVVTMTLTTPHCPVAESMPAEVEMRVAAVPGIRDAEVNLVWDPPWDPAKMSDEAKLELGML